MRAVGPRRRLAMTPAAPYPMRHVVHAHACCTLRCCAALLAGLRLERPQIARYPPCSSKFCAQGPLPISKWQVTLARGGGPGPDPPSSERSQIARYPLSFLCSMTSPQQVALTRGSGGEWVRTPPQQVASGASSWLVARGGVRLDPSPQSKWSSIALITLNTVATRNQPNDPNIPPLPGILLGWPPLHLPR